MSAIRLDLGDDLAAAEDLAATLARALEAVTHPEAGFDAAAQAVDALAEFSGYCRPTCGYLDTGCCEAPDPTCCGCICGHDENLDPLYRDPAEHPRHVASAR